jgi:hypothetical protein
MTASLSVRAHVEVLLALRLILKLQPASTKEELIAALEIDPKLCVMRILTKA